MSLPSLPVDRGRRTLVGALLILAALAAGCGGEAANDPSPSDPAADPAGGTRPAAITPQEALELPESTPAVVEGTLFAQDDTWRLCGALMESFPPQCSPSDSVVITNPDAIPEEDRAGLQQEGGVRWGDTTVAYAGTRVGEDGLEITGPADDPGLIGGDAAPPTTPGQG